jgi:putative cell wall-binding protein
MTAGVIGVTAGVAGATTSANTIHTTGTPKSYTFTYSTRTLVVAAGFNMTFNHTVAFKSVKLKVSASTGTVKFSSAPTISSHLGFSAATVTEEPTGHLLTVKLTVTATPPATLKLAFSTVKVNTVGVTGTINVSVTSSTPFETFTPSFATIATVAAPPTTTTNEITATAAPSVHHGSTQTGADLHVNFTHNVDATTLTLTVSAASGTVKFSSAPTPSQTGFSSATATLASTGHVVKVALVQTAKHTSEKVTFAIVELTTLDAYGTITVTASSTPAVTFTPKSAVDAKAPAAGPVVGNSITAVSAPTVPSTGTNVAGGNLVIDVHGTTNTTTFTHLQVTVAATAGTVDFYATPTFSTSTVRVLTATVLGSTLFLTLDTLAAGTEGTITLSGIAYDTRGAKGTIRATPHWGNFRPYTAATVTEGTFSPASAVDAKSTVSVSAEHGTATLVATSTPGIGTGTTGSAAGAWTLTLKGTSPQGWSKTETVTVEVAANDDTNCSGNNYVLVTGTPTATVSTAKGVSATPTLAVSGAAATPCSALSHNVMRLTFTNTGSFNAAGGSFKVMVSGVKYVVGSTTPLGNVDVTGELTGTSAGFTNKTPTTGAPSGPSNADVSHAYVTANTPAKTVAPSAFDATISPVDVTESVPGKVAAGYVCVSLAKGNTFNVNAPTAKAAVTAGTATVTAKVVYENATGAAVTSGAAQYAVVKVTKASSATASKFSVSGLRVDAQETAGTVAASVKDVNPTQNCSSTGIAIGSATAYAVASVPVTQIYGATADATAVHILETRFPANGTGTCVGGNKNTPPNRPVILATTKTYQDALAAQYLASDLHTGILLTPTASKLSTVTLAALRLEGVTQVDVVGGPLAVTTTVVNELETMPAYSCGGATKLTTSTGATRFISVTRIGGQTAADTAALIAERLGSGHVLAASFTGAYAGVNATKGNGAFNDTAGTASAAPSSTAAMPTAIIASDSEYQDALAASSMSYWQTGGRSFPILLTTTTKLPTATAKALTTLGIGQVIVMGGQLAVTATVVKALETMGIQVLRIAGKNYTDTSAELAKFEMDVPGTGLNWSNTGGHKTGQTITIARGNGFTDGLTGAEYAGINEEPLLLVHTPTTVGTYLTAWLKTVGSGTKGIDTRGTTGTHNYRVSTVVVFGGPLAVSPKVITAVEKALGI